MWAGFGPVQVPLCEPLAATIERSVPSTAATTRPMSQPRTVRSFVHSARNTWAKPSSLPFLIAAPEHPSGRGTRPRRR